MGYDETGHRNQHLTLGTAKAYHGDPVYLNDLVFSGPDDKGRYRKCPRRKAGYVPVPKNLF